MKNIQGLEVNVSLSGVVGDKQYNEVVQLLETGEVVTETEIECTTVDVITTTVNHDIKEFILTNQVRHNQSPTDVELYYMLSRSK